MTYIGYVIWAEGILAHTAVSGLRTAVNLQQPYKTGLGGGRAGYKDPSVSWEKRIHVWANKAGIGDTQQLVQPTGHTHWVCL